MKEKIGLGLITCNREEFFKKSYKSIPSDKLDEFVVISDGEQYDYLSSIPTYFIQHSENLGVGKSKNEALKYLLAKDCTHIFLMEDDVIIKDSGVFDAYVQASKDTGIKHFNFALHGNYNLDSYGNPVIKKSVEYPTGVTIPLYHNVLGALSYYHSDVLKDVGLMDEKYFNAMEHVDHTLEIIKAGYHPPFRWFADIQNSRNYLQDIVGEHKESEIRKDPEEWRKNFMKACDYFEKKQGFSVLNPTKEYVAPLENVLQSLVKILHKSKNK